MNSLELKGISKSYGNSKILSEINISLAKGEFATIIGANGSGKSTLLKIAAKILEPSSGEIQSTKKISYVPQQDGLLPWKTVEQNLMLPMQISSKNIASAKVQKILKDFELNKFSKNYPAELSGGMKQKLAIVRSMITSPELLLLDEPFSSLDAITRLTMQNWMQDIWLQKKPTVLLVTHDIREAILLSDRIFVFSERPGTVKKVFDLKNKHPRTHQDLNSKDYIKLEKQLQDLLI